MNTGESFVNKLMICSSGSLSLSLLNHDLVKIYSMKNPDLQNHMTMEFFYRRERKKF